MAARLGDDGTFDTVIYCSECGQEQRYNYDSSDPPEDWDCFKVDGEQPDTYAAWVDWCLEDFEGDHVCEK